ncbi:permease of the major facilitator superfamily [Thermoproteus tenax Kra 1]|uniref:Permease of the major facilitator superfamily n=2 Tax=Thermoproteus tenax TaxID=2271 RepID=G4RN41_THETK|nr:permease of the major facilitator superfamily [Thermoproteus tenax Kra 1]
MEFNYRLILMLGVTSLFADWLYEGMRAALPQYLKALGASALFVGLLFGVGDALGYLLRFATGPLADRRGGYWGETFAGYAAQVLAVAGLAIFPSLPAAAGLALLERSAKALRTPARDAIISAAGGRRQSMAFGIHASIDQIGAVLGALTSTVLLALGVAYRDLFLLLALPGAAALATLWLAYSSRLRPRRITGEGRGSLRLPLLLFAASQFMFGASLMHISLEMYGETAAWLASSIYLAAMAFEIPASLLWGRLHEGRRAVVFAGPPVAFLATLFFARGDLLGAFAGALAYSLATSYADIVAKAEAVRMSSGGRATALGAVNAAFGLGYIAAGGIYGYLLQEGLLAWAPAASLCLAAGSFLFAYLSLRSL